MRPIITLLTDFGTADGYVGEMKGVLLWEAPDAELVDISHDIPAQDVEAARLAIARYWTRFPPGTTHLVVVDPGVGSPRAALAVASDGRFLVGPDNGVLSPALLTSGARAVALPVPAASAPTFHGRDVFAPAAAALARAVPLEELGTPAPQPVIRLTPEPRRLQDGALAGEVLTIDRFGNAITNLAPQRSGGAAGLDSAPGTGDPLATPEVASRVEAAGIVEAAGQSIPVFRTYSDVAPGAPLALLGSNGLLEIAVREGSAAETLGLRRGSPVVLRPSRAATIRGE